MKPKILFILSIFSLQYSIFACTKVNLKAEASGPITVTDNHGCVLTVIDPVRRVVGCKEDLDGENCTLFTIPASIRSVYCAAGNHAGSMVVVKIEDDREAKACLK